MAAQTIENLLARRDAVVQAHIAAETVQHDVAAALATFHHPRYEVPAMGAVVDGGDGVRDLLTQLLGAFPDFWLEQIAVHHADNAVIVECRFGGTHRGPWAGIAAPETGWKFRPRVFSCSKATAWSAKKSTSITLPSCGKSALPADGAAIRRDHAACGRWLKARVLRAQGDGHNCGADPQVRAGTSRPAIVVHAGAGELE